MKIKSFLAALLVLAVFGFALLGQDKKRLNEDTNTRSLEGAVTDTADKPATGAVGQLKDMKTLQIRSYITREDGAYHFAGLSTNVDYEIKADKNGQTSGTKTLSTFDSRKAAVINLKLK